jgi:soluble lytic murein transglycosylase-like protein
MCFYRSLIIIVGGWLINHQLTFSRISPTPNQSKQTCRTLIDANFSPSVHFWQDEIDEWAKIWGLSPLLIATVMQIESCGDPQAISPAGAQGLFQVMPYHFQPGEDMLDPHTNARRGLAYLSEALQIAEYDIELTLAGYNGGHTQIYRDPAQWPAETRRYVYWGSSIYQDALLANNKGEALSAWLQAGGRQLCQNAETTLNLR